VKSLATGKPFRIYKGREGYSQWHFTYQDYQLQPPPGQPPDPNRNRTPPPGDTGRN
jgi:hypothetical protein